MKHDAIINMTKRVAYIPPNLSNYNKHSAGATVQEEHVFAPQLTKGSGTN